MKTVAPCRMEKKDGRMWCNDCMRNHIGVEIDIAIGTRPIDENYRRVWRGIPVDPQWRANLLPSPDMPSLITRAANYTRDITRHIANGMAAVPDSVRKHRLEICNRCEWRNKKENACAHPGCGCPLQPTPRGDALSWASKSCPIGKWHTWSANMAHHSELQPDSPVELAKKLLLQPPGPWPSKFQSYQPVIEAFKELLREHTAKAPPMPKWPHDRGIVICGGGWRFFPSIYVTVRAIRHLGIDLPIQVWYMGDQREFDERMQQALEIYDVGWIDANSYHREHPDTGIRRPIDHGWLLKPYAACYAPFREVICLDADSMPVRPLEEILEHPEYQRVGACFFPDHHPLDKSQWERFGLAPCGLPGLESGQFVVDKSRHWKPLWLSRWINDFYEYVWHVPSMNLFGHLYGDKDTYAIAWQACGHEMCVPRATPGYEHGAFLQPNFDGHTQFVHYTRNKFKLSGTIDDIPIDGKYHTDQTAFGQSAHKSVPCSLPLNNVCQHFIKECDELLRPENNFALIGGARGWCRDIWDGVTLRNEYQLPDKLDGGIVIDLGANVGAFSHWARRRGASKVIAVEPWPENIEPLKRNAGVMGGIEIIQKAVWKNNEMLVLSSASQHIEGNTSTVGLLGDGNKVSTALTVTLDELIGDQQIKLIKIDIEGAEGPVLAACTKFDQVEFLAIEVHDGVHVDNVKWSVELISELLTGKGYIVDYYKNGPMTHLLYASKE